MGRRSLFVGLLSVIACVSLWTETAPAVCPKRSSEAGRVPDAPLDKQIQPEEFQLLRIHYRVFRFRDWSRSTLAIKDRLCTACMTYEARFAFETLIDNGREVFLSVPSSKTAAFLEWIHTDFARGMKETYPSEWAAHQFAAELVDSDLIMHVKFKLPRRKSVNTPPFSTHPWGFVRPNRTQSLQPEFACGAKRLMSFLLDEADSPLGSKAREELRNRLGPDRAPGDYEVYLEGRQIDLDGFERACPDMQN